MKKTALKKISRRKLVKLVGVSCISLIVYGCKTTKKKDGGSEAGDGGY